VTQQPAAPPPVVLLARQRTTMVVRAALWLLCLALALIRVRSTGNFVWLAAIAVLAAGATTLDGDRRGSLLRWVEGIAAGAAVVATNGADSPFLPYLFAPAFAAGLFRGPVAALIPPGLSGAAIVVGGFLETSGSEVNNYSSTVGEWVLLAVAVGLIAAWIRRLQDEAPARPAADAAYESAYRLLSQLRVVSRELSAGLDSVSLGQGMLERLAVAIPHDRSVVFVRSGGDRLIPLAHLGGSRPDWHADLTPETLFAEAWVTQEPQMSSLPLTLGATRGASAVFPLRAGVRTFGLVALESDRAERFDSSAVRAGREVIDAAALRLETALLFDEIREVATAEERRRLAREIHDGIAQELASLGYVVDDLMQGARESAPALVTDLQGLRAQLTRLITELRLSIFELRSDVEQQGSLGAALSEFVRGVGRTSDLTVHLTLEESPRRLPREAEAELLRIAQEAITNARKHAHAQNLWVTCTVDPPRALLLVEDDGVGVGPGRHDSYGFEIMRERAARLRATLQVVPRRPNGTSVEVRLGVVRSRAAGAGRDARRRTG
jgi:signal transduction histidine kinase